MHLILQKYCGYKVHMLIQYLSKLDLNPSGQ